MRLIVAFVLMLFVFGQSCIATPSLAVDIVRRSESVLIRRPARTQNIPVARLGVPFMFQLDSDTFTVVDLNSGAPSNAQFIVALDRDSNTPGWINFNPDNYIFSGTPDAVTEDPFRIRLIATVPGSSKQNDTIFDLYVSDIPSPYLVNTLEYQQNRELMHLENASFLATSTGVWTRSGASFAVQMQPFCNRSSENTALYYSAYLTSNLSMDALPQWLHFDNVSLSLTGAAPLEPTSMEVILRCSNVFGAGGLEQRLGLEVANHILELDGAPFSFQLAPGYMFSYNFDWLWSQLYLDGKFLSRLDPMRFFNSSPDAFELDASKPEIDISFSLEEYPWLSFDRYVLAEVLLPDDLPLFSANKTIYGRPPIVSVLPQEFASVPLNISCRGRKIVTEIPVYSLAASAWHPYREVSAAIPPGVPYSHNFTSDLLESVASNSKWSVFIRIDDPLNSTSWLTFNTTTHVLHGTAPMDSPSRDIAVLLTSNAWGFNTSIPYTLSINNPYFTLPTHTPITIWSPTSVALLIALAIVLIFLALSIFIFCGLRKGWLVSPSVLATYHRRRHRSSQTLVGASFSGAGVEQKADDSGNLQVHVEKKIETRVSVHEGSHKESDPGSDETQESTVTKVGVADLERYLSSTATSDTSITGIYPTGTRASTNMTMSLPKSHQDSAASTTVSGSPTKTIGRRALNERLDIFKKRKAFGNNIIKGVNKRHRKLAAPSLVAKPNDPPFTPMWKGHIYQTPELLRAEERAWRVRRLERKARLKREYFARKRAEAQGAYTDVCLPLFVFRLCLIRGYFRLASIRRKRRAKSLNPVYPAGSASLSRLRKWKTSTAEARPI